MELVKCDNCGELKPRYSPKCSITVKVILTAAPEFCGLDPSVSFLGVTTTQ